VNEKGSPHHQHKVVCLSLLLTKGGVGVGVGVGVGGVCLIALGSDKFYT
jgi:hypothetical protein